jgi:thiol:disulfide interchange protein
MEKNVFQDEEVISTLSDYVIYVVDLTKTKESTTNLMKTLGVVAPPALIFIKEGGNAIRKNKELNKKEMLEILKKVN